MPKLVPNYVFASLVVSLGGFLNGYDTGTIGAVTHMAQFTESIGPLTPLMLGFTVSLIMLTGAVPSIFAGYLADRFGRLKTIIVGALLFGVGALLQGTANHLAQFLFGRALAGLGEGVYLSAMTVYVCEIAPFQHRGSLAGLPQFMTTAAICVGYFTCYRSVDIQSSMAWRTPYVVMGVIAVVLTLGCLILPDSPRWLVLHGRSADALDAVLRLEMSMVEAERDVLTATEQRPSLSLWQGFRLLFTRAYRSRTVLALFLLGMIQLSGIDGVLYYAPILFAQAGMTTDTSSFLASGLSTVLMLLITIPAVLFVDKWGRRTSAITGGVGLSACMFLIGSLYAAGAVHPYGIARWAVIVAVFVFGLTYCATWAIVGKLYASEIQPGHTRAAANSLAQGLSFLTNWLVAIVTPILLDKSAYGAYFLFGGLALGNVIVFAAYMPETRGRSLEDIQTAFKRPTMKGLSHYLRPRTSGRTRRDQQASFSAEEVEMDRQGSAAVSSVGGVARGLRLDVSA